MTLVRGLFYKPKHPKAPDFVIANLSAKRDELMAFLRECPDEWVNMQILMSRAGKPYIALDEWKAKPRYNPAAPDPTDTYAPPATGGDGRMPFEGMKEPPDVAPEDEVKISDIPF